MEDDFTALCRDKASDGNSTSDIWLLENKTIGQVTAAFLLLILVVGLPWNLLVVFTIVKEKLYHQPTIVLLLNLVINDILFLVTVVTFQVVTGLVGEFTVGNTDAMRCRACKLGNMALFSTLLSLYTIAIMAFDRFLYIYKPLHYSKIVTSCRMILVIVALWVILAVMAVTPLLIGEENVFIPYFITCLAGLSHRHVSIVYLVIIVTPILALMFFNTWLVVIVQKNIHAIYNVRKSLTSGSQREAHRSKLDKTIKKKRCKKQLHLIQVFVGLVGSTLISWLPVICFTLYFLIEGFNPVGGPTVLSALTTILYTSQVTLHPIIETVLLQDVREPLKRLVCLCVGKGRRHDGAYPDESGRSWSCDSSRLGCCGEFLSVLQAAMLEHSRHSHSEQGERSIQMDISVEAKMNGQEIAIDDVKLSTP